MNRSDFQQLADVRIAEAQALLGLSMPDGAYYLAGYAVECAVKSCISGTFGLHEWPEKKFVNDCHTHVLADLLRLTGLDAVLNADAAANPSFRRNWNDVKDWNEHSRNQRHSQAKAQRLIDAITNPASGVLQWIKARW